MNCSRGSYHRSPMLIRLRHTSFHAIVPFSTVYHELTNATSPPGPREMPRSPAWPYLNCVVEPWSATLVMRFSASHVAVRFCPLAVSVQPVKLPLASNVYGRVPILLIWCGFV